MKEISLFEWKKSVLVFFWNSCHGHIFIIIWWLKLKFVTLSNFFKTSHFKRCDFCEKSSETSHFKNCDFWKFIFRNQSLVIDYVTLYFKFWKLKCLEAMVIDYKYCVIDYKSWKCLNTSCNSWNLKS